MLHGNLKMFARFARNIVLYVHHRPIMCLWFYVYSLNPCPTVEVMTNYNKVGFSLMCVCLYRTINMLFCPSSLAAFYSSAESYTEAKITRKYFPTSQNLKTEITIGIWSVIAGITTRLLYYYMYFLQM